MAIGAAASALETARTGLRIEPVSIGGTPATVFSPQDRRGSPSIVIAHGFAGSQQLMRSFGLTLARNGYIAVTFDFAGHGRNPAPLAGSITETAGATRVLVSETARIATFARTLGDGRLAVLGHSMASDIVVRFAQETPDVLATIAVSMFSPAVTASSPANLLVIVGDWEGMLKTEALRAVGLHSNQTGAVGEAQPDVTYGEVARGTARRATFSPSVEHVGVLYSSHSMREALAWLDQTFGVVRSSAPTVDTSGPWILLLLAGVVGLARPASTLLPVVSVPPIGGRLPWQRMWPAFLVPMVVTPLLLRVIPTHFLPVLVADYLAAHFALYGLVTAACLYWLGRDRPADGTAAGVSGPALAGAAAAFVAFSLIAIVWPIDTYGTSFVPGPERYALVAAMTVGTLMFFASDEWLTRGLGGGQAAYAVSKLAFLVSLALAVVLDFERLFFLIIIVPVIVLFFLVFGLFSAWTYARTGHPLVAAIGNGIMFAWAIGTTFPLLAG